MILPDSSGELRAMKFSREKRWHGVRSSTQVDGKNDSSKSMCVLGEILKLQSKKGKYEIINKYVICIQCKKRVCFKTDTESCRVKK